MPEYGLVMHDSTPESCSSDGDNLSVVTRRVYAYRNETVNSSARTDHTLPHSGWPVEHHGVLMWVCRVDICTPNSYQDICHVVHIYTRRFVGIFSWEMWILWSWWHRFQIPSWLTSFYHVMIIYINPHFSDVVILTNKLFIDVKVCNAVTCLLYLIVMVTVPMSVCWSPH
jgi:hypothetical protein